MQHSCAAIVPCVNAWGGLCLIISLLWCAGIQRCWFFISTHANSIECIHRPTYWCSYMYALRRKKKINITMGTLYFYSFFVQDFSLVQTVTIWNSLIQLKVKITLECEFRNWILSYVAANHYIEESVINFFFPLHNLERTK